MPNKVRLLVVAVLIILTVLNISLIRWCQSRLKTFVNSYQDRTEEQVKKIMDINQSRRIMINHNNIDQWVDNILRSKSSVYPPEVQPLSFVSLSDNEKSELKYAIKELIVAYSKNDAKSFVEYLVKDRGGLLEEGLIKAITAIMQKKTKITTSNLMKKS
jgi:hypothetical protein